MDEIIKKLWFRYLVLIFVSMILILLLLTGGYGGPSAEDLAAVDYTPLVRGDWKISTSKAEGLDQQAVAKLYYNASQQETLYGLLVVKNGKLAAEGYYNAGSIDQLSKRA